MCYSAGGVIQESLKFTWRNQTLKFVPKTSFSPSEFPRSKPESSWCLVQLLLPAAGFNKCSRNTLMLVSIHSKSLSKIKKNVIVPSLGSNSGSSDSSRALCFRISTTWSKLGSWSWEFSDWKTPFSIVRTKLRYLAWCGRLGSNRLKSGDSFIYEGWNFNSGNYLFTTDTK